MTTNTIGRYRTGGGIEESRIQKPELEWKIMERPSENIADNKILSATFKKNLYLDEKATPLIEEAEASSEEEEWNDLANRKRNSSMDDEVGKFSCSFASCQKEFGKRCRLVLHERTHTGERPFKCSYQGCQRSYTRQFHLTRHVAVFHSENISVEETDKFRCAICSHAYSNKYSLKKHAHIHQEQRFSCPECSQTFTKQQHLKTHSSQHTGILPYRCEHPGCGKGFPLPSKLVRHSKVHIPDRYNCHYQNCSQKFNLYSQLIQHLAESHLKVCAVCGKEFQLLSRLRAHLLTHQESREASFCPYSPCDRYYFDPRNLKNHIDAKHEKNFKGFLCHVCDKWLVTKQKLKDHINIHDPKHFIQQPNKERRKRKPRKDKGTIKINLPRLLSGYNSECPSAALKKSSIADDQEEGESVPSKEMQDSPSLLLETYTNPQEKDTLTIERNEPCLNSCVLEISNSKRVQPNLKRSSREVIVKEKDSSINILDSIYSSNLKLLLKKGSSRIRCKLPCKRKNKSC